MTTTLSTTEALSISAVRRMCANGEIRQLRESFELSLAEMTAAIETSPQVLSRWERKERRPNARGALRLRIFIGELLGFDDHDAEAST